MKIGNLVAESPVCGAIIFVGLHEMHTKAYGVVYCKTLAARQIYARFICFSGANDFIGIRKQMHTKTYGSVHP